MKSSVKILALAVVAALFAGCASSGSYVQNANQINDEQQSAPTDSVVKIGAPYKVGGKIYSPADIKNYDEVGYASWYGQELGNNQTASGEKFDSSAISAAHKTLPLPSYVEVTALDTGRTILVRINDRGPFVDDRLIDLSHGAAQQLGIDTQGAAPVRVRRVNPPEQQKAVLRNGGRVQIRLETSNSLLSILREKAARLPRPDDVLQISGNSATSIIQKTNVSAPRRAHIDRFIIEGENSVDSAPNEAASATSTRPEAKIISGSYYVQVAALSIRKRAEDIANKIGAKVFQSNSGSIYRVRYGPYRTSQDARQGLQSARENGYTTARVFREKR